MGINSKAIGPCRISNHESGYQQMWVAMATDALACDSGSTNRLTKFWRLRVPEVIGNMSSGSIVEEMETHVQVGSCPPQAQRSVLC